MMILSPAKTMDLSPYEGSLQKQMTLPQCNLSKTLEIVDAMKSRNEKELTKLLSISSNLGKTANEYWETFENDFANADAAAKPCIYAFTGVAYQGLQVQECSDDAVLYLQNNIRIIDPLYGSLRPLDKIQAYRLEMSTRGVFKDKKIKLSDYWKDSVTESLANDLKERKAKLVLNVASDEYSSAVDPSGLPSGTKFVKINFLDGGRVVTVHAKRARGLMARFVGENNCQTLEDVKKFDYEGYKFSQSNSNDECLVFERTKEAAQKRKGSGSTGSTKKRKK